MKLKHVYVVLCVCGVVLPYAQFIPWVAENGLNAVGLIRELFSTRIGAFFGLDVIVSAIVLLVFVFTDSRRQGVGMLWLPVVATFVVGVSLGLPLYLLMRELHHERIA